MRHSRLERVDRTVVFAAVADERRQIASLIDGLDAPQLTSPSLCSGWDVKTVAEGLDETKPHTVKLTIVKRPDTKNSTNNDVFSVQVDRKPVKNTTFEAYYEATGEGDYNTDTLLFRLSGTALTEPATQGLLIDDVTIAHISVGIDPVELQQGCGAGGG